MNKTQEILYNITAKVNIRGLWHTGKMDELKRILDYCESIIDVEKINKKIQKQKNCLRFEPLESVCVKIDYPNKTFTRYTMQETHDDFAKMMVNELIGALSHIESDSDGIPMIRANYGVGILPSAFGVNCRIVNDSMPWCDSVGREGAQKILLKGMPDIGAGFGQKVLDAYAFFKEQLSAYPKCKQAIKLYHPDYQGAFDIAHLIFGADIYWELYDDPDFVCDLMQLISQTYVRNLKFIKQLIQDETEGYVYHWGHLFPGSVVLRDDSAVNLSKDMYNEFIAPFNNQILSEFGSGSVHFCGRADQWVFEMAKQPKILGYNVGYMNTLVFGQEYLDFIKPAYYDSKKAVVGYVLSQKDFESFDFKKYNTGVSYNLWASDKNGANELLKRIEEKIKYEVE